MQKPFIQVCIEISKIGKLIKKYQLLDQNLSSNRDKITSIDKTQKVLRLATSRNAVLPHRRERFDCWSHPIQTSLPFQPV